MLHGRRDEYGQRDRRHDRTHDRDCLSSHDVAFLGRWIATDGGGTYVSETVPDIAMSPGYVRLNATMSDVTASSDVKINLLDAWP
jgi:hypothetical protein